jgi:general secretion pathway protein K
MSMRQSVRGGRRVHQRGYVLIMVLSALAMISFVALRFAERMDQIRQHAVGFNEYVAGRANASSARASTLYWMATRTLMPSGRGDGSAVLREDGRSYSLPGGAKVSVQDERGLLPLNGVNRPVLLSLLLQDGMEYASAQAWLDMLEDYIDTDDLKRLNGAERAEYVALGLPPPRNDWLLSVRELQQVPLWRNDLQRVARLSRFFSASISNIFNPNTAPSEVLRVMLSGASPAQLDLVMSLRQADLLTSGTVAMRSTGLALDRDDYRFAPGHQSRLTVWAPGLPRAFEYTASLTPASPAGPWAIIEQGQISRPGKVDETTAVSVFPLVLVGRRSSLAASAVAP